MGAVCRLRSVPARNLSCPLPMPLPNTDPTAPASETLTVDAASPPAGVQPMVFVDLETTGGNATMDRITEIGIVELHADGTSEWSSLVNPQARIPPFIERLTGISNAMVEDAPAFEDLAATVLQRLQGRLFVAHNARFDYGFLKNEFKRVGIDFRASVLCTVRLSRKLFPQFSRHNLDSLIERHRLQVDDRHRALGDARLIRQFWHSVQTSHSAQALELAVTSLTGRPSLPPHLDAAALDDLPEGHGVYLFYGENALPLYIGKSKTLRRRVLSHFSADHRAAKEMSLSQQVRRVDWVETQGELGSLLKESALVKQLQPTHNQRLRRARELCSWQLQAESPGGSLRPVLRWASDLDLGRQDNLYGLFTSQRDAKKQLTALATEHQLCLGLLGLESTAPGKPCFAQQLGRCAGACVGKQAPALHNARLLIVLQRLKIAAWPYPCPVGLREGSDLHVIDAWCHLGTARSESEAWDLLDNGLPAFDKDAYSVLRNWLPRSPLVMLGERPRP